ncbi:hypothetical protein ACET3Z_010975 [Daucus carota]
MKVVSATGSCSLSYGGPNHRYGGPARLVLMEVVYQGWPERGTLPNVPPVTAPEVPLSRELRDEEVLLPRERQMHRNNSESPTDLGLVLWLFVRFQKTWNLLIPAAPFIRTVREISFYLAPSITRLQAEALRAIQEDSIYQYTESVLYKSAIVLAAEGIYNQRLQNFALILDKDVVDGDLCEQFPTLPMDLQRKIADELDRTPGEILEKHDSGYCGFCDFYFRLGFYFLSLRL